MRDLAERAGGAAVQRSLAARAARGGASAPSVPALLPPAEAFRMGGALWAHLLPNDTGLARFQAPSKNRGLMYSTIKVRERHPHHEGATVFARR
jgi:hypothetical protein